MDLGRRIWWKFMPTMPERNQGRTRDNYQTTKQLEGKGRILMNTREFILNQYNRYGNEFEYTENPMDYIDEIKTI